MKSLWFCLIMVFTLFGTDLWGFQGISGLLTKGYEEYAVNAEDAMNADTVLYAQVFAVSENVKLEENGSSGDFAAKELHIEMEAGHELSAMEALDLVMERYAANFERHYITQERDLYFYKLPDAQLYLVYEGFGSTEDEYLIHLYEFVIDEPESSVGHCYSYAWYSVDKKTGCIYVYEP